MAASARPAITGHGLGYDSSALICVTCTSTIVNTLLAGALKAVTDKLLQRVLNAATRMGFRYPHLRTRLVPAPLLKASLTRRA